MGPFASPDWEELLTEWEDHSIVVAWRPVTFSQLDDPSNWVNYNDLTATSLGMMVSKGNHPNMALLQVGEIL